MGRYTIERLLGKGRYGLCFLARSDNGGQVVIKKYRQSSGKDHLPDCIDEAVILSRLNDERIPEFLGVLNENGFYGFVLAYKKGETVKELLFKHHHVFFREEFYQTGLQLIDIIKYLHAHGVVHRDIRLPNVVIDQGRVCLIDFGLARRADQPEAYALDFSYLSDFFLYLLYSSFTGMAKRKPGMKELPWYDELPLKREQILFLKRLFGMEERYDHIRDIEKDFIQVFNPGQ